MAHCGKNLVPCPSELKRSCKTDSRTTAGHKNIRHDTQDSKGTKAQLLDSRLSLAIVLTKPGLKVPSPTWERRAALLADHAPLVQSPVNHHYRRVIKLGSLGFGMAGSRRFQRPP